MFILPVVLLLTPVDPHQITVASDVLKDLANILFDEIITL